MKTRVKKLIVLTVVSCVLIMASAYTGYMYTECICQGQTVKSVYNFI